MAIIFEKFAALLFLALLVGLVLFLTYVPLPPASEKAVLMIIGGLMTLSTQALPRLFGADSGCQERIDELETELEILRGQYKGLTDMLVQRHVIQGEGFEPGNDSDD